MAKPPTSGLAPRPAPSASLATSAYAHAVAVLGPGVAAVEAAIAAVGRGGRSQVTVLAHARDAALERAHLVTRDTETAAPAPDDLADLARLLAFTRPPIERAVIDLESRHGLDRAGFGRAIGLPPAQAQARAAEAGAAWQRELDPVLLARLGPGGCEPLARELASTAAPTGGPLPEGEAPPRTLARLIAEGRVIVAHAESCHLCADRLRSMVSIRTLLAQIPLEDAPRAVEEAAAAARRRPSAPAPLLERVPLFGASRWPAIARGAVTALLVLGVIAAYVTSKESEDSGEERVDAAAATRTGLVASPAIVDAMASPTVRLRNLTPRALAWELTTSEPWITVEPATATLGPRQSIGVVVRVAPEAPEGDHRASLTFTARDGSTAVVRVRAKVARAPDVAAQAGGCEVVAQVEDDSQLAAVVLHQRAGEAVPMRIGATEGTWVATLASGGGDWWVTATDAFGNEGRTPDHLAEGC